MTQLYKKNGVVFIPAGITVEEVEKLKSVIGTDKAHAQGILKDTKNASSDTIQKLYDDVEKAYKNIKIETSLKDA